MLASPVFIISIDVELAWGLRLHPQHKMMALFQSEPQRMRQSIDSLIKILDSHDIGATWAVLGHLFLDSAEVKEVVHPEIPQMKEGWLGWDFYQNLNHNHPGYYGRDVVETILAGSSRHEIGLHGFFHLPFSECSRKVAEAEVEMGIKAAGRRGVVPVSFVFPEDSIGHVDILRRSGFQIYRGKGAGLWNKSQGFFIQKASGARDKVLAPPVRPLWQDGIWEIASSMYFCDPQMPFTLVPRARLGLWRTIRSNRVFHIWLHPWSFLLYNSLERDLESFLSLVAKKRDRGELQVMTMGELASYLNRGTEGRGDR